MTGTIFDIQRFSVHDGPGIRTTVFLKGCPLRCQWCHNPEGLHHAPQLQFFREHCIGCGRCGTRSNLSDAERCPTGALKVCGQSVDSTALLPELLKDKDFFADDGGVTFSGGECLIQPEFVSESLALLKQQHIHTAVDTSGCVPWENIAQTLPHTDLYLYDVKCASPELHRQFTGLSNERILENLHRLSAENKPIWIRVPVIPGFNDTDEELSAVAAIIAPYRNIQKVTLMPYHSLGRSKYETLGLEAPYRTDRFPEKATMEHFRTFFRQHNFLVD